jgi:hypothetical protein
LRPVPPATQHSWVSPPFTVSPILKLAKRHEGSAVTEQSKLAILLGLLLPNREYDFCGSFSGAELRALQEAQIKELLDPVKLTGLEEQVSEAVDL